MPLAIRIGFVRRFRSTAAWGLCGNECVIVQSATGPGATDNNATCTENIGDPTGAQSCGIYQLNTSGGANNAVVQQQISAAAAPANTQDATQNTEIGQWATSGANNA